MNDIEFAERIKGLEVRFEQIEKDQKDIKDKLDELLELRSKGMGAFWLASALLGTGIIGVGIAVFRWLNG